MPRQRWDSAIEPPKKHRDWFDATFNFSWGGGGSQLDYVLKGGDFIGDFAAECIATQQKPFVTVRLNDGQMCSHVPAPDNSTSLSNNDHTFDRLSQFWWERRENASVILGMQGVEHNGWKPCCWGWGGHTCSCSNAACELSWNSAAVRDRIVGLIGEMATIYAVKGVRGISLDFERGLNYFPDSTPPAVRARIMTGFVRQIRAALDATGVQMALGLRLQPNWAMLRSQGLGNLAGLVAPVSKGGCGVTYFNWGIYFYSFMPFDSEIASLAAATPAGTPFYFEVSSWTGVGPKSHNCSHEAKVRTTKEELWTTALIAKQYGAQGLSAFNFVYTREFYDFPCEYEENKPYSEPLFRELGMSKNATFLSRCADQYYRLEGGASGGGFAGPLPVTVGQHTAEAGLRVVMVPPVQGYQHPGRLRLLTSVAVPAALRLVVRLNGQLLERSANSTPLYDPGVQPKGGAFLADQWLAWSVPPSLPTLWNNSVTVTLAPTGVNAAHGIGRGPLNNTDLQPAATYHHTYKVYANKRAGALACQRECDADARCQAWSYVVGHAGGQPAPGVERCCRHGVVGCPVRAAGVMSGARFAGASCSNSSVALLQLQLAMPVSGVGCP